MTEDQTPRLLVGRATSSYIRFVVETNNGTAMETTQLELEPQAWDVTDPSAREIVGRELLGDAYDAHCQHRSAQWWINEADNSAALAVYRPMVGGQATQ